MRWRTVIVTAKVWIGQNVFQRVKKIFIGIEGGYKKEEILVNFHLTVILKSCCDCSHIEQK